MSENCRTILILDDEPNILNFLSAALRSPEITIHTFDKPISAVTFARHQTCDILITDMKMPEMDGEEVIDAIRALQPNIETIVMSGHTSLHQTLQLLKKQVDDYMTKPLDIHGVRRSVELACKRIEMKRKNNTFNKLFTIVSAVNCVSDGQTDFTALAEVQRMIHIMLDADHSAFFMFDGGEHYRILNWIGDPVIPPSDDRRNVKNSLLSAVSCGGKCFFIEPDEKLFGLKPFFTGGRMQSGICVPLTGPAGQGPVMGAFCLFRDKNEKHFTEEDRRFIELAGIFLARRVADMENMRNLHATIGEQGKKLQKQNQMLLEQNRFLQEMNRIKSDLVATASHELRTPLTTILGFSELIQLNDRVCASTREQLDIIHASAVSMTELINDMLDLYKIETDRKKLNKAPGDLVSMLRSNVNSLAAVHEDHHFVFETNTPQCEVLADQAAMKQVIKNLLSNAVKYTPGGGRIRVTFAHREDDGRCLITVRDDGLGIKPGEEKRIFDRFYRTDEAVSSCIQGTGLGLSLVKTIIEKHGGAITCESEWGKGSTFIFWIPIEPERPAAREHKELACAGSC